MKRTNGAFRDIVPKSLLTPKEYLRRKKGRKNPFLGGKSRLSTKQNSVLSICSLHFKSFFKFPPASIKFQEGTAGETFFFNYPFLKRAIYLFWWRRNAHAFGWNLNLN
jgi:hypothetical protein